MSYVIPPVNTTGKFELASPFDNILSPLEEYTVTAVRSINEIMTDDPLNNIYIPVGLTITDMEEDVKNGIPIVALVNTGGEYIYVPADKFLTIPLINGKKHQEKLITISTGLLPKDFDLNTLITSIEDLVYNTTGSESEAMVIENSAILILDDVETKKLELYRENIITIKKSNKTRYEETLELLKVKEKQVKALESYIKRIKSK